MATPSLWYSPCSTRNPPPPASVNPANPRSATPPHRLVARRRCRTQRPAYTSRNSPVPKNSTLPTSWNSAEQHRVHAELEKHDGQNHGHDKRQQHRRLSRVNFTLRTDCTTPATGDVVRTGGHGARRLQPSRAPQVLQLVPAERPGGALPDRRSLPSRTRSESVPGCSLSAVLPRDGPRKDLRRSDIAQPPKREGQRTQLQHPDARRAHRSDRTNEGIQRPNAMPTRMRTPSRTHRTLAGRWPTAPTATQPPRQTGARQRASEARARGASGSPREPRLPPLRLAPHSAGPQPPAVLRSADTPGEPPCVASPSSASPPPPA